ncbi:MAG: tape measure protein [Fuscovulum sp.]|nr:tape measure protein [Fuscovulum sp.]
MADLNVALILRLVDKATGPARAAMRALARLGGDGLMAQANTVSRGAGMMAVGLGRVTDAARTGAGAILAYQGLMVGIAAAFVRPAAQFERFNVQLTNLEGSSEGAKKAMVWIEDFATRTPLELEDTVAAYARLRAFGIDPTNGSMQAIVDTMAATGGNAETMEGIVLALGQAWTKGKLQGEEAMQMLERGIPVWDLLAEKTGKSAAELMKMSSAGELGRSEITLLIEALGEKNAGAAEKMSQTWDGIISNLMDNWTRFQRMVMDSGLFQFMKDKLQGLLTFLNAAAADGRMQAWAESLAATVMTALRSIYTFGVWVRDTWQAVFPVLDQVATAIGGWDVVGWIALLALFRGSIFGLVIGFAQLLFGSLLLNKGLIGIVATLIGKLWPILGKVVGLLKVAFVGALTAARGAIAWLVRALLIAGRALMANPIIAVLTAIAGLAYVIYDSWDGIVAYFTGKVDRVRAAFDEGLLNGVLKLLSEFNPFVLIMDAAEGLFTYITGWTFDDVRAAIADAFGFDPFTVIHDAATGLVDYLSGLGARMYDAGMAAIQSLLDGMIAKFNDLIAWVKGIPAAVTEAMGSIDMGAAVAGTGIGKAYGVRAAGAGAVVTDPVTAPNASGLGADWNGTYAPPQRELGGAVRAGRLYEVGERGRELFTPDRDGWIIPNRRLARASGGGGGVTIGGITINAAAGQSPEMIARAVRAEIERLARQARFALDDGAAHA